MSDFPKCQFSELSMFPMFELSSLRCSNFPKLDVLGLDFPSVSFPVWEFRIFEFLVSNFQALEFSSFGFLDFSTAMSNFRSFELSKFQPYDFRVSDFRCPETPNREFVSVAELLLEFSIRVSALRCGVCLHKNSMGVLLCGIHFNVFFEMFGPATGPDMRLWAPAY